MKLGILEGLLFVMGEDGLAKQEIAKILEISEKDTDELLKEYQSILNNEDRGLKLVCLGNKYKLSTNEEHKKYYELLANQSVCSEPISVGKIDEIRGVSSRDIIRKLLFRGLIDVAGKSDLPGKPMLYKTTDKFLDYFNLSSINELPKLKIPEDTLEEETELFITKYKENK